ncbi:MAG: hypothetical protein ACRBF0_23055 [Calditrichia bacterium]
MNRTFLIWLICLSLILLQLSFAQIPRVLTYQGLLTETSGAVVPDGEYQFLLSLYEQETGGQAIYDELQNLVPVIDGIFNVQIGSLTPLGLPFDKAYWLEVEVDGEVHAPRRLITSAAYSFNSADIADSIVTSKKIADGVVVRSLNGLTENVTLTAGANVTIDQQNSDLIISATGGGDSLWATSGTNITFSGGKVGIGAVNPSEALDVIGNLQLPATSANGDSGIIKFGFGGNSQFQIHNYGPINENVFIGQDAGNFTLNQTGNIGIGRRTLNSAISAAYCTAVGHLAMENNTIGIYNTALGSYALHSNTAGQSNTALGSNSLFNNSTGGNNIAIGSSSLFGNVDGSNNVALGSNALSDNISGSGLTAIGANADVASDGLNNATAIGYGAKVDASNKIRLGNDDVTLVETSGTVVAPRFEGQQLSVVNDGPVPAVEIRDNTGSGALIKATLEVPAGNGQNMIFIQAPVTSSTGYEFLSFQQGTNVRFRVDNSGNVFADGAFTGPADFAEMLEVSDGAPTVEAGDVLVIDPNSFRSVQKSTEARSRLVAGIYSSKPGFVGSARDWEKPKGSENTTYTMADMAEEFNEIPMAVIGIVPCKVSAENGPILPGDLLVTSAIAGHAMRDESPENGTVVGKALGRHDSGTGVIRVLVMLQ